MSDYDVPLLKTLDPKAVFATLRFQGALTARLATHLGQEAVERAFSDIARFELVGDRERYRLPLVSGQVEFLKSDLERRFAKGAQCQLLRCLCRWTDDVSYAQAYNAAIDETVEGSDHRAKREFLRGILDRSGSLLPDPNSNSPAPPEHGPLFRPEFDLRMDSLPERH